MIDLRNPLFFLVSSGVNGKICEEPRRLAVCSSHMLSSSSFDFAAASVSTPFRGEFSGVPRSGGGLGLVFDLRPLRVCMELMDSGEGEQLGV